MESILSSFHLSISSFSELLHATGAIVAGSAALAAYIPNIFTPNDLDIWVHSDFNTLPDVHVRHGYMFLFTYFLRQHGYQEVYNPTQSDAEYSSDVVFSILRTVQRFQHTDGHIVQVMHCNSPIDAVLETFDLSVAKTWWTPSAHPGKGNLYTASPIATESRMMYSLREPTTEREKARIQKYEARGFTHIQQNATPLEVLSIVSHAVLANH